MRIRVFVSALGRCQRPSLYFPPPRQPLPATVAGQSISVRLWTARKLTPENQACSTPWPGTSAPPSASALAPIGLETARRSGYSPVTKLLPATTSLVPGRGRRACSPPYSHGKSCWRRPPAAPATLHSLIQKPLQPSSPRFPVCSL